MPPVSEPRLTDPARRRARPSRGPLRRLPRCAAAAALALVLLVPAAAEAGWAEDSYLERGSGVGLAVFGTLFVVPMAFILADPPTDGQTVTGRALTLTAGIAALAFSGWYFGADDPGWYPHGIGWGVAGALAITGITLILTSPGDPAASDPPDEPSAVPDSPPPSDLPASPVPAVALAPFALPAGGGLWLAAAW